MKRGAGGPEARSPVELAREAIEGARQELDAMAKGRPRKVSVSAVPRGAPVPAPAKVKLRSATATGLADLAELVAEDLANAMKALDGGDLAAALELVCRRLGPLVALLADGVPALLWRAAGEKGRSGGALGGRRPILAPDDLRFASDAARDRFRRMPRSYSRADAAKAISAKLREAPPEGRGVAISPEALARYLPTREELRAERDSLSTVDSEAHCKPF